MMLSFVLVKPDAIIDPVMHRRIEQLIIASGVAILDEFHVQLGDREIGAFWPQFPRASCPYTFTFLRTYYAVAPCRAIVVSAPQVIVLCNELKRLVRREYPGSAFANRLHCPANQDEVACQLGVIWARASDYFNLAIKRPSARPWRGVWGRVAACSSVEVEETVSAIWNGTHRGCWSGDQPISPSAATVTLYNDDTHSLDYVASCIAEAFPHWSPVDAVAAAVEVDRLGQLPLARGHCEAMSTVHEQFIAMGLNARWRHDVERVPA